VLLFQALYKKGADIRTVEGRRASLVGLLTAQMVISELLDGVNAVIGSKMDFELYQATPDSTLLFTSNKLGPQAGTVPANAKEPRFVNSQKTVLGGRELSLRMTSTPDFEAHIDHATPRLVFAVGAMLSALLAFVLRQGITGQRRAESLAERMTSQLRHDEERSRDFSACGSDWCWETDAQHRFCYFSENFEAVYGLPPQHVLGKHRKDLWEFNELNLPGVVERYLVQIDSNLAFSGFEYQVRLQSGVLAWMSVSGRPYFDSDGCFIGYRGIGSVITARKQEEDAQLKAGALQSAIFNSANFSSIATDANGVIQIFIVGAERMLGYAATDVMNKITPADISDAQEIIVRAKTLSTELETTITPGFEALVFKASRGIEDIYELTYIRKDGSRFPAVVSVTALRDAHDAIIGYLLIGTDNTARKLAEAALALEVSNRADAERIINNWLRLQSAALDACGSALLIVGVDGVIQWVNPAFCQLSGYDVVDAVGHSPDELFNTVNQDEGFYKKLWPSVLSGKSWTSELVSRRKDGTKYHEEMTITSVYDVMCKVTHLIVVKEDITEHKRIEEAAHAANRAKSDFLANMSHEIRTPLGGLLGMLELLSFSSLDEEQAETLQSAHDAGGSLLRILNDILDFSKMAQGKLELAMRPASIAGLVAEVANTYSHVASGNSVTLSYWVDSRLSKAHVVDPLRLSQVLNNFVSNAIKFGHGGKVEISAELVKQHNGAEELRFSVRDDGIGMSPEVQQRLFLSYEQGSADTARMYGGTGLGLSICRRLAVLMDAQIEVRSAPSEGSTFYITLSLAVAPESALVHQDEVHHIWTNRPEILPLSPDAPQVLVVDDNAMNRKLMARQLALLGLRSDCAENGEEAFVKWRSGSFAFVITDCHMPVMDGYALTRAIRAAEVKQALPRTTVFA
jgi:PAS domain S-box-containing protein